MFRAAGSRIGPIEADVVGPGDEDRFAAPLWARIPAAAAAALEEERARWFVWSPVLFGLGIGFYFSLSQEPPAAAIGACALSAIVLARLLRSGAASIAGVAAILFAAGLLTAKLRSERIAAPMLERPSAAIDVKGYVELAEPRTGGGTRLTLAVTKMGALGPSEMPVRARIRAPPHTIAIAPGDAIILKARLAPPAEPVLPGGFDFARTAWFQGIGAVGFAVRAPELDTLAPPPGQLLRWRAAIERVRRAIAARVMVALPGETGAIAAALITGERGAIPDDTNEAYRNSGLFHILSISGLHMVVMAGAAFYAVRLLLAAIPALALSYPIKKWAAAVAALAALAYLMMTGAAFATLRSYVMISIMFLAVLLDRPAIAMRNVAVSALIILALYPESLLDAGFQMSFAAVVALVAVYEALSAWHAARNTPPPRLLMKPLHFLGGILLSTFVAGTAVAPFAAYHFHASQQFALIANLIAIPICNIVVMPAALLTLLLMPFGLEGLPLWVMGEGITAMTACAHFAAGLPGAVLHIPQIPFAAFLLMVADGLWVSLWETRWRLGGFLAVALGAGLMPFSARPDILVGRDGALIAVRGDDGRFAALTGRQSDFELSRWLEHDGDGRKSANVTAAGLFRCDASGCVARAKGLALAYAKHASALADDCRRARVLIAPYPVPRACRGPREILDYDRLRAGGTHALYLDRAGNITIESVAEVRGERPWTRRRAGIRQAHGRPAPAAKTGGATQDTGAVHTEAAEKRRKRSRPRDEPRPEVEDDSSFIDVSQEVQ